MSEALAALIKFGPSITKMATDLVSTSDAAKRNAQLIEFQNSLIGLQSLIASVQQENSTLIRQKSDAEEELKRMKNWEGQKQRYSLAAPFSGCMVMALKKSMSDGQPAHYLCASCFQKDKASILQSREARPRKEGGRVTGSFVCSDCGTEAFTSWMNAVAPEYLEDIMAKK
jgi:hypothetical protein